MTFGQPFVTFGQPFGDQLVTHWWPISDLFVAFCVTFWWTFSDLLVKFQLPFGDPSVTFLCHYGCFWWPFADLLMAFQCSFGKLLMNFQWPFSDHLVTFQWHFGNLSVTIFLTFWWPFSDFLVTFQWPFVIFWWPYGDLSVACLWPLGNFFDTFGILLKYLAYYFISSCSSPFLPLFFPFVPSFSCFFLYLPILSLSFQIYLQEFGTDCLGLVNSVILCEDIFKTPSLLWFFCYSKTLCMSSGSPKTNFVFTPNFRYARYGK